MVDLAKQEELVEHYIKENKTDEAIKLLFDLIVAHAKEKNFEKAEALNDRLYDVDPMALTEIVRAGEIIEEAKSESLDKEHLEIWSELYDKLSPAEGNALYYSMKSREFEPGEPIMEQGTIDNCLYFINKGEVKVIFRKEDKEQLLLTLGVGDIFGQDQFFSATVCTASMIPLSRVKVTCLQSDVLKKWKNDTPALESKLYDYCRDRDKVKQTLAAKGMERREYSRTPLSGKMVFHLLDGANKSMGKAYKGEISDLSAGGLSFLIKTSKPETIRMLLGRRLQVKFDLVLQAGERHSVDRGGLVIAVQSQAFDDFSIHLKFEEPLDQSLIEAIKQGV